MVASVSSASLPALTELPRDVSSSVRWGLVGAVMAVHVVVAALVVKTSRQEAVQGEVAPISVSLLTETPSGELVPAAPAVVRPSVEPLVQRPVTPVPVPAVQTAPVLAAAAPAQPLDMVVPAAPAVADAKPTAEAPVAAPAAVRPAAAASAAADAGAQTMPSRPVQLSHTSVRYLKQVDPVYPKASARLGESGTTYLSVLVDEHGQPVSVTVSGSSGYSRLDAAARDAALQSRYVPYTTNGVPQRFEVRAPYVFKPPVE